MVAGMAAAAVEGAAAAAAALECSPSAFVGVVALQAFAAALFVEIPSLSLSMLSPSFGVCAPNVLILLPSLCTPSLAASLLPVLLSPLLLLLSLPPSAASAAKSK